MTLDGAALVVAGTAIDNAGNTNTASVTVSRDTKGFQVRITTHGVRQDLTVIKLGEYALI
jgi:hypothetical protein